MGLSLFGRGAGEPFCRLSHGRLVPIIPSGEQRGSVSALSPEFDVLDDQAGDSRITRSRATGRAGVSGRASSQSFSDPLSHCDSRNEVPNRKRSRLARFTSP